MSTCAHCTKPSVGWLCDACHAVWLANGKRFVRGDDGVKPKRSRKARNIAMLDRGGNYQPSYDQRLRDGFKMMDRD